MRPHLDQLRSDCIGHAVDVVEVNLSDPRHATVARERDVRAVPLVELVRADGVTVARLHGERPLAELRSAAARLAGRPCAGLQAHEPAAGEGSRAACSLDSDPFVARPDGAQELACPGG